MTHSSKHWSNETTMIHYVHSIIIFCHNNQDALWRRCPTSSDYGQLSWSDCLEATNIHIFLLPPDTTNHLQTMDLSINKPAKDFFKRKFKEWCAGQVKEQMDSSEDGTEAVNLGLPMLKELEAKWLVEMVGILLIIFRFFHFFPLRNYRCS